MTTSTAKTSVGWRLERHKKRMAKQAAKRKAWLARKKNKPLIGGVA